MARIQPGLQPAAKGRCLKTSLDEKERHPGARGLAYSGAIRDNVAVARNLANASIDFVDWHADRSGQLHARRRPRDDVARVDKSHALAPIEDFVDLRDLRDHYC